MATNNIGKTKRSTDELINDAVDRQQSWLENRRTFTRNFLSRFHIFNKSQTNEEKKQFVSSEQQSVAKNKRILRAYWLPIVCAILVIFIAATVTLFKINTPVKVVVPSVPEPVIKSIGKALSSEPTFDLVRIEQSGNVVIAGRNIKESNISIVINKKVVATEHTNQDGEFVYAPTTAFEPGNYIISLVDADNNIKSKDSVFVYISEHGYKNSVSLLMTEHGSKVMQAPELLDGDLVVSKIDYLDTGRMVVTGKALPRLRVSLTLNDKYLGFARVSDYKNFGLGANVGELKPGENYTINVRLHDGEGTTIASFEHSFIMPNMTDDTNTFYTVRRGDCLWIIARNFLRKGVLFTMIAERNNIKNPDLIFPDQLLQIPTK